MAFSGTRPRKRLTREESRAQTRATLIAVGRKHFLRHGLGGAVAEKIAEDAGYSRGALYANFNGKEELFVAVIQEEQARHVNVFRSLLKEEPSGKKRLKKMRDAIADLMTDHDWIVLRAEFEVGALRSERIRQSFIEVHRQQLRDGSELVRDLLRSPEVTSKLKPDDFITVITNLAHGLAVTQRILGAELSQKSTRNLVQSLFDHLISSASRHISARYPHSKPSSRIPKARSASITDATATRSTLPPSSPAVSAVRSSSTANRSKSTPA
jgi:TetR/AcrR family transcriptional regulator, transcriptional repressor of aconitase